MAMCNDGRFQLKKAITYLPSSLADAARALLSPNIGTCSIFNRPESNIPVVIGGLDYSGKTTFLYRLVQNDTRMTTVTSWNVERVKVEGAEFLLWDVGGGDKMKPMHKHFYPGCHGILFMIDSTDKERMQEARDDLHEMMKHDDMPPGIPLVVVANKQDLPDVIQPSELVDLLDLEQLSGNPWHIQAASAINGDGVTETINKMAKMIEQYKKNLHG
ncbi:ADP-ribosylation factor-like [Amphiura filiformis]|uniref:ADP-ribosylation factor-like n=1 Tax=Amphiura filiformis TaxID=82378 RepID=UPI003B21A2D7